VSDVLKRILHDAREARDRDLRFLAVFDLDSTLFDIRDRQRKIVLSFIQNPENQKRWPDETSALANFQLETSDFGIRKGLERAGLLKDKHEGFIEALLNYWELWFFHNNFLEHDTPLPGAVEFVKALESLDADIMYLTGRDVPRMLDGTIASLRSIGFPLDEDHVELCLKPEASMDDAIFKMEVLKKAERRYHYVWLFENEPVNLNLISKKCPKVKLVYIESCHAGLEELHNELDTIKHFEVDLEDFREFFRPK
jgi:hypothetical protein